MRCNQSKTADVVLLLAIMSLATQAAPNGALVIKAARLYDGVSDHPLSHNVGTNAWRESCRNGPSHPDCFSNTY